MVRNFSSEPSDALSRGSLCGERVVFDAPVDGGDTIKVVTPPKNADVISLAPEK
jgi:hypothetical protein